jgi:hypothetical protein
MTDQELLNRAMEVLRLIADDEGVCSTCGKDAVNGYVSCNTWIFESVFLGPERHCRWSAGDHVARARSVYDAISEALEGSR